MIPIRQRLLELVSLLNEIGHPPAPPDSFLTQLNKYETQLRTTVAKQEREIKWTQFFGELAAQSSDETVKKNLQSLSEIDIKAFCDVNNIKYQRATKAKIVKGAVTQRAVKYRAAKDNRPARTAIPEIREPDRIIPGLSSKEATILIILNKVRQSRLKS